MWTRFADHHPGQRLLKIAAHTGLTEDRTRSPVPGEEALHNGRQPQKLLEGCVVFLPLFQICIVENSDVYGIALCL